MTIYEYITGSYNTAILTLLYWKIHAVTHSWINYITIRIASMNVFAIITIFLNNLHVLNVFAICGGILFCAEQKSPLHSNGQIKKTTIIRRLKLKLRRPVHNISLYKTCVFITDYRLLVCFLCYGNFHWLIMRNVEVGLYCYFDRTFL